jgi:hypothetical protein
LEEDLLTISNFTSWSGFVELVDLNVVFVVVGDKELEEAIIVEVVVGQWANCAAEVLDHLTSVSGYGAVGGLVGSHQVGWVITITSNKDVSLWVLWRVDYIGETGAHVGNQEWEGVLEAIGDDSAVEGAVEEIWRNIIEEDGRLCVVFFMVVDEELIFTIIVNVEVLNWVNLIDGAIDNSWSQKFSSLFDLIDWELVIEEFGTENDERIFETFHISKVKHDIRALSNNCLSPGSLLETLCRVLIPNKFSLASLSVATSGQIILATITIDVNPDTHMVEEPRFVRGDLEQLLVWEVRWGLQHIDVSIGLARGQESVRDNNSLSVSSENLSRDYADRIGPLELVRQELRFQVTNLSLSIKGILNIRDDRDLATGERTKFRDQEEFLISWVVEFLDRDKSWGVSLDGTQKSVGNVCSEANLNQEGGT